MIGRTIDGKEVAEKGSRQEYKRDYRMKAEGRSSRLGKGASFFSSPRYPDRFWGPPSLLSSGYRGHFPRGSRDGA
jgi:hypothetical protein